MSQTSCLDQRFNQLEFYTERPGEVSPVGVLIPRTVEPSRLYFFANMELSAFSFQLFVRLQ